MVQTNFRAQDFGKSKSARNAAKKASKKAVAKKEVSHEVPEGTSDEVLAWVGNNPNKARRALATERKDGSPRVTLTASLNQVIKKAAAAAEKKENDRNSS